MKKLSLILALAILLGGGAVAAISGPACAQGYYYPPPPSNQYAQPWVGSNTPWVYNNGDWFLKGILYNFFGQQHGWAPYYSYPQTYTIRPQYWYGPRWNTWYQGHPRYWQDFYRSYPYWAGHREGQRYDRRFYEEHHRGQGGGWHKGFKDGGRLDTGSRTHPDVRDRGTGRGDHSDGRRGGGGKGHDKGGKGHDKGGKGGEHH